MKKNVGENFYRNSSFWGICLLTLQCLKYKFLIKSSRKFNVTFFFFAIFFFHFKIHVFKIFSNLNRPLGRVHVQTSCVKPRFWNLGYERKNVFNQLGNTIENCIYLNNFFSDNILKYLNFYIGKLTTIFFFLKT